MSSSRENSDIRDQGLAAWIASVNAERRVPLYEALDALQYDLDAQDQSFAEALAEIDWVRRKIGTPERILGNPSTKHGEIAEIAEVGVRRAKNLLHGRSPGAFWNADARLAPEDYGIDGVGVQAKFVNGVNNTLRHVREHAEKYPRFGVQDKYYHIPKDYYETIRGVLRGDALDLNARTVSSIREHVRGIEEIRDRSFDDLVRPASHDYGDVQQGRIDETLNHHDARLLEKNAHLKEEVVEDHRDEVKAAQEKAAPSVSEMGDVAFTGAAVGAGITVTATFYRKWNKEGKLPTDFTQDDWIELGVDALKGGGTGGIAASSLYLLTNYSALGAPFAGAIVSSGRAMTSLVYQYRSGDISLNEFTDLSMIASSEAGMAAAGAALGQTLIPIPILGALVGSATARVASSAGQKLLKEKAEAFDQRLQRQFQERVEALNIEHEQLLAELEAEMLLLGDLTAAAFDLNMNARLLLLSSIRLAEEHEVEPHKIIRTTRDVDAFIQAEDSSPKSLAQ